MQPEPSTVSPQEPTESTIPVETSFSDHHGLRDPNTTVSLFPADNVGAETTTPAEQIAADAAVAASLQDVGETRSEATRRLSPKGTPSPPPGYHRITEYEQASTPPIRKREGPGFEVIKKIRSPSDKRSPVQELPNGS